VLRAPSPYLNFALVICLNIEFQQISLVMLIGLDAAHGRFSHILQVAPMCTPYIESQKLVAMATSLRTPKSAVSSSDSLTPKTHP